MMTIKTRVVPMTQISRTYKGSQAPLLSGHIVDSPLVALDLDLDLPRTLTPGTGASLAGATYEAWELRL